MSVPRRCRTAAAAAAIALAGCGLAGHDVTVSQPILAGGGLPAAGTQFSSSSITAPLAASAGDLSRLSSVTLQSATLESTDGLDLAFIASAIITVSGNGLPTRTLATLGAPGPVGLAGFLVQGVELKPYLAAGGTLDAAVTYAQAPAVARGLRLTVTIHASL